MLAMNPSKRQCCEKCRGNFADAPGDNLYDYCKNPTCICHQLPPQEDMLNSKDEKRNIQQLAPNTQEIEKIVKATVFCDCRNAEEAKQDKLRTTLHSFAEAIRDDERQRILAHFSGLPDFKMTLEEIRALITKKI